ncbi:MAG: ABC transporter permease [Sphingobacteriales bacterium JAD_PAG50586_3]|nr:MAG: ABC transporter permease [Sphingobacteriales bacterium JAD_PAG50586_3]
MNILYHCGKYFIFLGQVFSKPERGRVYLRQTIAEIDKIGLGSLPIVAIMSVFMGAVITVQTAASLSGGWIPMSTVGYATRESILLEFSPTIIALILAGKVGSNIASEIGTMRVTEQIDALEIMGINPAGYLVLPKIIAAVLINPFVIMVSMFLGVFGGWLAAYTSGIVTPAAYIEGIQQQFIPFHVTYSLIKTLFFAFGITSISAYHGYHVSGGALEVGAGSTRAVVYSSIVILLLNYVLTQLLLI